MKPIDSAPVAKLGNWVHDYTCEIEHMAHRLRIIDRELHGNLPDIRGAIDKCAECIDALSERLADLASTIDEAIEEKSSLRYADLSAEEIDQLTLINQNLGKLPEHLRALTADLTLRLGAKVADLSDPMYDYKLDFRMDFILQENDPFFDQNDDNILATRIHHSTFLKRCQTDEKTAIFADAPSEKFLSKPHCWLFHDLYDHSYGPNSPCLPLKDCLRIGSVWVDLEITQQYEFDMARGEMVVREFAEKAQEISTTKPPTVD